VQRNDERCADLGIVAVGYVESIGTLLAGRGEVITALLIALGPRRLTAVRPRARLDGDRRTRRAGCFGWRLRRERDGNRSGGDNQYQQVVAHA
jgi:hypothetical protein